MPPVEGREGDSGEPSYAAVFAGALLDPDLATPAAVAGPKSKAAGKRYDIYRNNFPNFIEQYEYAQSVPWLADVARIERAWLDAYHAADIQPLMPHALASIPSERLVDTILKPHPAARIVRSRFPAVTIFTANRSDGSASRVEVVEAEDALLTRPALDVEARRLPPGGAIFVTRLIAGDSLGTAASAALSDSPSFDLAANISGMLEAGAFTTALYGESR